MDNKNKLIEFAARLMSQDGYTAVSMNSIVEKTSISKSNLYYHYETKEQLGIDVLKFWTSKFLKLDEISLRNTQLSTKIRLSQYFDRLVDFQINNRYCGNPCWILADELNIEIARGILTNFTIEHCQNIEAFVRNGQKVNIFSNKLDAKGTSVLIWNSILGAEINARTEKSIIQLVAVAQLITQLLFEKK